MYNFKIYSNSIKYVLITENIQIWIYHPEILSVILKSTKSWYIKSNQHYHCKTGILTYFTAEYSLNRILGLLVSTQVHSLGGIYRKFSQGLNRLISLTVSR